MSTDKFDRAAFEAAHRRFTDDVKSLTDADLAQFAIVDPAFAERARAQRAGFVEAELDDEELRKMYAQKLSMKNLLWWQKNIMGPVLASYRYEIAYAAGRLVTLEARILELEAQRAADHVDQ